MLSLVAAVVVASTGPWSCEAEDERVTGHLRDALGQLSTVTPAGLDDAQRARRARLLEDLARYVEQRRFPRSSGPTGPVFVDDDDRHCAMGALLAWNGGAEIVARIRTRRNLATVPVLADEPGLAQWLDAHGMTAEEAALVQPTYFDCVPALEVCFVRETEQWLVSSDELSPSGQKLGRIVSSDGLCAGPTRVINWWSLPPNVVVTSPAGLVVEGDRFLERSWLGCRDPLRITRAALAQPDPGACMRQMIADDPRALLPMCGDFFGPPIGLSRCGEDGRYRAGMLPPMGIEPALRSHYGRRDFDLDDAGVSFAAAGVVEAEAWAHSDDGGTVPTGDFAQPLRWNGVNPETCVFLPDGGVENDLGRRPDAGADGGAEEPVGEVPASCGCSGASSTAAGVGWGLLLLVRRRSRASAPRYP